MGVLAVAGLVCACSSGTRGATSNSGDAISQQGLDVLPTQMGALQLISVTPSRGPLAGGGQIDVEGVGFADDAKVFLGEIACDIAWRGGKTHLYAIVPPVTTPQTVDVKVQSGLDDAGQPRVVGLTEGYVYFGETSAASFSPALGPALGGTQITIRGSGFRPGDKILVGWREASDNEVVDESTLIALTPPATDMGTSDEENAIVAVRNSNGVAVLAGSFLYGKPPQINSVDPGVVPLDGGDVTLNGFALGHADELYAGGLTAILAAGTASDVRGAKIPSMTTLNSQAQPGVRDMLISSPFGATSLSPAFAYVGTVSSSQLLGVAPATGPAAGGTLVTLLAALPAGAHVTGVTWDGSPVTFALTTAGSLTLQTPAHGSGPVAVAIQTDAGNSALPEGFTYVNTPHIDQITPGSGPPDGGTDVLITGSHFDGDCTVRIGTWLAQIESNDGSSIHAITPPGPLGSADVVVACGTESDTLVGGFQFTDGLPHVNAVVPAQGATGGATPVTVYGSGFRAGMLFYFGGQVATDIVVTDSGSATMLTPAHDSGPVNVDGLLGANEDTLLNGYNFFDATSADGGTWGEAVAGTLNVNVIDYYTLGGVSDATVVLGAPGDAIFGKYKGLTDQSGSVVFSGPDIVGPITVTAGKVSYSASSIVSFDAQNATLILFPENPQGSGGGPPPPINNPLLEGRVRDFEKYIAVPPANCLKSSDAGDRTCDTCVTDADCVSLPSSVTFACIDNGPAGKRCLADCTQADVCNAGFGCYAESTTPGRAFCKPEVGIRKVFCATSQRDMNTPNDPPPSGASGLDVTGVLPYAATAVDEATGDFQMTGRLDELAIVCVGGYVTNDTKLFVPSAMGVRRHVMPQPSDNTPATVTGGLDVELNIALTRNLATRLDNPQANFPASQGGSQEIDAWLNLGSDGVIEVLAQTSPGGTVANGNAAQSGVQANVTLAHLPMSLPVELTDTTWLFQGDVTYGDSAVSVPPETGTIASGLKTPGDLNMRVRSVGGTWSDVALGVSQELTGVLRGVDDELLVVTRRGLVYRGPLAALAPIYQPLILDPYAEPLAVLAAAGTPTDATFVGEMGLVRHLQGQKVTDEAGAVTTTLRAVCQNTTLRAAVGDAGALEIDVGKGWQQLTVSPPVDLRAVACTSTGAVAVGAGGTEVEVLLNGAQPVAALQQLDPTLELYAMTQADDGTLWAGGQLGTAMSNEAAALWKRPPGGQWQEAWPAGASPADVRSLRLLVALPNQTLLAIDRQGSHWRVDAAGVTNESPDHLDQRPEAGVALSDGSAVLVGEPGLWLGPFLTVPAISSPDPQTSYPFTVTWSAAPGHEPSCNRIHLDGSGFPFWWIYLAPDVTTFPLPDLAAIDGISVFPNNQKYQFVARVDRIYVPGTTINSFATFDLEFGQWRSWSTNAVAFHP